MNNNQLKLDANQGFWLAEQLNQIEAEITRQKYPELWAKVLMPVDTSGGMGLETWSYLQFTGTGMADWYANYADNIPTVGIGAAQYFSPIKAIATAYEWSVLDVQAAIQSRQPLNSELALLARQVIEKKLDDVAWLGGGSNGVPGLLTNPNITRAVVADGATSSKSYWEGATAALSKTAWEIYKDMYAAIKSVHDNTNYTARADELWIAEGPHGYAANTPMFSNGGDLTVLEYFKRNNPGVTVRAVNKLDSIGTTVAGAAGTGDTTNVMIALRNSPQVYKTKITMGFTPQQQEYANMKYKIPCLAKTGGTVVKLPLEISMYGGI